jgi:xylose isomerase
LIAQRVIDDKVFSNFQDERYRSFASGIGATIMSGKAGLEDVEQWVLAHDAPVLQSARQEMLENIMNTYLQ